MLVAVAKMQGTPTYKRYYRPPSSYSPQYLHHCGILRELTFRPAYDPPVRVYHSDIYEWFLANDSHYDDIRRLREHPRLVLPIVAFYYPPPSQPFYLFILSGKGWEIWKLKPEAFDLIIRDQNYHLCYLTARSATDSEIYPPSRIVFTDTFYRKSGQVSFYVYGGYSWMVFYPLEGVDGTLGYAKIRERSGSINMSFGRYIGSGSYLTPSNYVVVWFGYPTIDGDTVLILPTIWALKLQPTPTPQVPTDSVFVTSKNAVFAHYEGVPMNGKVIAPLNVASGQITVPTKRLKVTYEGGFHFWEEDGDVINAPKLGCGIWALPSEDPDAKLDGYNYYSLSDIDAELVEQHTFDFFEPQITFKVSSRDDKCLYMGVGAYGELLKPAFLNKSSSAEVVSLPPERATFYYQGQFPRDDGIISDYGGTTDFSMNYWFYNAAFINITFVTTMRFSGITEGAFPPEQKNKDVRFNIALRGLLPKTDDLKALTTYLNPSFTSTPSFYGYDMYMRPSVFYTHNLNELMATAPTKAVVGGVEWIDIHSVFLTRGIEYGHLIDMPVGVYETEARSDLTLTDRGSGRETVKVLVWQPMWFSHSFTADPNYGDILATFGFKVITIASPPRVEYIVSGFQVCSAWFQNLLKRLRGTELKDAEKALLRDCVASLDGFFGAIRVTFHYDRQTGLIYMREWRLGVPFGDPVPLTTFNLQPYHEIRALKDFWSWSLYLDIIDTRTQTIVKRIKIIPTVRSWIVGEVNPSQPVAFTQRKSFANPLVGVNPSSPYTVDRNLGFTQVVGHNPHALISPTLTNINPSVYRQDNYPTRFYPLQAPVTSLRSIPTEYQTAAQKFYGSQVPVVPIQFGNLNAQPIYVATIPITREIRAKRDVPYEVIAKWGVGVAIFAAGTQWATLLPYGLADLGNLLHWTVVEFWEGEP